MDELRATAYDYLDDIIVLLNDSTTKPVLPQLTPFILSPDATPVSLTNILYSLSDMRKRIIATVPVDPTWSTTAPPAATTTTKTAPLSNIHQTLLLDPIKLSLSSSNQLSQVPAP